MLKLNQFVTITPEIQNLLIKLDSQKTAFALAPQVYDNLKVERTKSLLGSALYSARIEGNPLTENTYAQTSRTTAKLEVQNLYDTYTSLDKLVKNDLDLDFIRELHSKSLKNLRSDAGHFRTEQSAIFNQAGVAVYLTPPASDITSLLAHWLKLLNVKQLHPVIQNIIAHYQFEKIHPFLDGNGRVGRLLFTDFMIRSGYQYTAYISIEKSIHDTRDDYYYHLSQEKADLTGFAMYFLTLITDTTDRLFEQVSSKTTPAQTLSLTPRRQEILATITDHSPCSADFIYRRFLAIPKSTIRYDLLRLQQLGHIHKLGSTRGVLYAKS